MSVRQQPRHIELVQAAKLCRPNPGLTPQTDASRQRQEVSRVVSPVSPIPGSRASRDPHGKGQDGRCMQQPTHVFGLRDWPGRYSGWASVGAGLRRRSPMRRTDVPDHTLHPARKRWSRGGGTGSYQRRETPSISRGIDSLGSSPG
jgi:hypothetical protein